MEWIFEMLLWSGFGWSCLMAGTFIEKIRVKRRMNTLRIHHLTKFPQDNQPVYSADDLLSLLVGDRPISRK
jgi:hypothetical protein